MLTAGKEVALPGAVFLFFFTCPPKLSTGHADHVCLRCARSPRWATLCSGFIVGIQKGTAGRGGLFDVDCLTRKFLDAVVLRSTTYILRGKSGALVRVFYFGICLHYSEYVQRITRVHIHT